MVSIASTDPRPTLGARDRALMGDGASILGIDEVGRGSLAGPVVVCGTLFEHIPENSNIQDSKKLSPRRRAHEALWVRKHAADWLLIEIWPETIDRVNILEATILAMRTVVAVLQRCDGVVVIDGVSRTKWGDRVHHFPRADAQFFAVAAASIVAKVHRDCQLCSLAKTYPHFAWENNKGYGSVRHRRGLQEYGSSFLHRRSFSWSPVLP